MATLTTQAIEKKISDDPSESVNNYLKQRNEALNGKTPKNMFPTSDTVTMAPTPQDSLPMKAFVNDDGSTQQYVMTSGTGTQLLHGAPNQQQINSLIDLAKKGNSQAVTLLDRTYNYTPRQNKQPTLSSQAVYDPQQGVTYEHPYYTVYDANGVPQRVSAGNPTIKQDNMIDYAKASMMDYGKYLRANIAANQKQAIADQKAQDKADAAQATLDNKRRNVEFEYRGTTYTATVDGNDKIIKGSIRHKSSVPSETNRLLGNYYTTKTRKDVPKEVVNTVGALIAMGDYDGAEAFIQNYEAIKGTPASKLGNENPKDGMKGIFSSYIPADRARDYVNYMESMVANGLIDTYPMRDYLAPFVAQYYANNPDLVKYDMMSQDFGGQTIDDVRKFAGTKVNPTLPYDWTQDSDWDKDGSMKYNPKVMDARTKAYQAEQARQKKEMERRNKVKPMEFKSEDEEFTVMKQHLQTTANSYGVDFNDLMQAIDNVFAGITMFVGDDNIVYLQISDDTRWTIYEAINWLQQQGAKNGN